MAVRKMKIDEFTGFGRRLMEVARKRGLGDPMSLANAICQNEECSKIVRLRKSGEKKPKTKMSGDKKSDSDYNPDVDGIKRIIQKHLTDQYANACNVPSAYMYAYSVILDCSLDYLYGKTKVTSSDIKIVDICRKTGMSEDAVTRLVENMSEVGSADEEESFSYTSWWSDILSGDGYYDIPRSWLIYASRALELDDINKQIRAFERAEKEVELNDSIISLLLNEGGNHKSLQIKKRNIEDSYYGSLHRMLSCMEDYLLRYANAWAEKQHTDYEEKFYKENLRIRKALKAEENKE